MMEVALQPVFLATVLCQLLLQIIRKTHSLKITFKIKYFKAERTWELMENIRETKAQDIRHVLSSQLFYSKLIIPQTSFLRKGRKVKLTQHQSLPEALGLSPLPGSVFGRDGVCPTEEGRVGSPWSAVWTGRADSSMGALLLPDLLWWVEKITLTPGHHISC